MTASFLQGHVSLHLMGLMIIAPFYMIKKRMECLVRTIDRKVCLMSELYCPYVPLCNGQQIASWIALFDFEKLIMKLKYSERSHGLGVLVIATIAVSAVLLASVLDKSTMATIAVLSVFTVFSITLFLTSFAFAALTSSIEEHLPKIVREQRVRFAVHDTSASVSAEMDARDGGSFHDSLPVPSLATPRSPAPAPPISIPFQSQSPRVPVTPRSNPFATQFSLSHSMDSYHLSSNPKAAYNETAPVIAAPNLTALSNMRIPITPRSNLAATQFSLSHLTDAQSPSKQTSKSTSNLERNAFIPVQVYDIPPPVPVSTAALDFTALSGYLELETYDKGDGIEQDPNISDKLDVLIGYLESNHVSLKLLYFIPANFATLFLIGGYAVTAMITAFSFISAYGGS